MFKKAAFILLVLCFQYIDAQITLNHNIGTKLIETDMPSCENNESWARIFKLSDFGIGPNEQFIIRSGQVALSKSNSGARLYFGVSYFTDYPPQGSNVLRPTRNLGSRGIGRAPVINGEPQILQTDFEEPIVVPAGTDRIMVSVYKQEDFYNPESAAISVAGTEHDTGETWYKGCDVKYIWTATPNLPTPVENANFFINVTGEAVNTKSTGATTRLTHNVCDDVIETDIHSCKDSYIYWARAFTLKDFGISPNEEFIINSGQVGVNKTGWTANLTFNIYEIDDDFPNSFSEADLIGSSQTERLNPSIGRNPQVIQIDFETPVLVPAGVERILVEVHKGIDGGRGVAFIAGSSEDNDISWQRNCTTAAALNTYISTADFGYPNANFYINVTGKVNNPENNFEMNISNICSEFLKEFSIENKADATSVIWDFGDPASGAANRSNDLSPFHDFSEDGTYTITATVTAMDGTEEVLKETIDVKEPPKAYGIDNVYACEDAFNPGFSRSFDVGTIRQQVLGGQTDKVVTFIDGSGNEYDVLPNPFTNTIKDRETISVRVAHKNNSCCYSETTFDLIINPVPNINNVPNLIACDDNTDGIASFDISNLKSDLIGSQEGLRIDLFDGYGQKFPSPLPRSISNKIPNQETISAQVTNTATNCSFKVIIRLIVGKMPEIKNLDALIGCDDNNDGISAYFDTSNIESLVLDGQEGMEVTYFDNLGNALPSPLPSPYTNTTANKETITVRVTNAQTGCFAETPLNLVTSSQPQIDQPSDFYTCEETPGFGSFDTTTWEKQIIGNQTGLTIHFFDENGTQLPDPLPSYFQNTTAGSQRINVRVENVSNPLCYAETTFELIVNPKPVLQLEKVYLLCQLEPTLEMNRTEKFDRWEWRYDDGNVISTTPHVSIAKAGGYTLNIGKMANGIWCTNTYNFKLQRSVLPTIEKVNLKDWSDANYVEIIAAGDGDFEYSLDGMNYQDSNRFDFVSGGTYTVKVRDKNGCGSASREVVLVDYPKFFTPNNDGYNDYWQIKGLNQYPEAQLYIFDRFGKLLKQLLPKNQGWDGTFNGQKVPSGDYWFSVDLKDGRVFKNHFTLKR